MTPDVETARAGPRQWLGLAVLLTGMFVASLDTFIVFLAVPTMQASFDMSFAQTEMVVAGYTLALGIGLITSGRLGDRYGRRRLFVIGLFGFTATSGLCGVAWSAETLVIARLLQGVSAAILSPQVLAIIRVEFTSPKDRATAFGWMGAAMGVGAIAGQVVGGLILSADLWDLTWRPLFLLNIPIGILALCVAPYVLRESRAAAAQNIDLAGIVLSTLGLALLLFPLMEGREAGWPGWTFLMLAVATALLCGFAAHQHVKTRRGASPLLDTTLFAEPGFSLGVALVLVFYAQNAPLLLSLTYLLQTGLGHPPLHAALIFSPMPVAFVVASYLAGRVPSRNARRLLLAGVAISALGAFAFLVASRFPSALGLISLLPGLLLSGFGQGLFMTPILNVVLNGVCERHAGAASGVLVTVQRVGNAAGVAVLGIPFFAVVERFLGNGVPADIAYADAFSVLMFCVIAMFLIVAAILFGLPGRKAR